MFWIYLSPHLDDAVLSCGGMIWEQIQTGDRVEIWTICAGDTPQGPLTPFAQSLHDRWETGPQAAAARRAEDVAACAVLGAGWRHFDRPDVIYRRLPESGEPAIMGEEDLFRPSKPGEAYLVDELAAQITALLPVHAQLVSPLGMGGHVDHRLVRASAERLGGSITLWYYPDYPYIIKDGLRLEDWIGADWEAYPQPMRPPAVRAWQDAIAAYPSQFSTFWKTLKQMHSEMDDYSQHYGLKLLWRAAD